MAGGGDDEEYEENAFIRVVRRVLPITDGFIGNRMLYRHGGHTNLTPLFVVVLALGSADLMFAFDANTLPFINGGRGVEWAPEISVSVSLGVIVVTLAITVVASLVRTAMDEGSGGER